MRTGVQCHSFEWSEGQAYALLLESMGLLKRSRVQLSATYLSPVEFNGETHARPQHHQNGGGCKGGTPHYHRFITYPMALISYTALET